MDGNVPPFFFVRLAFARLQRASWAKTGMWIDRSQSPSTPCAICGASYPARLKRMRGGPGDDRSPAKSSGRKRQQRNAPASRQERIRARAELEFHHRCFLQEDDSHRDAEPQRRRDSRGGAEPRRIETPRAKTQRERSGVCSGARLRQKPLQARDARQAYCGSERPCPTQASLSLRLCVRSSFFSLLCGSASLCDSFFLLRGSAAPRAKFWMAQNAENPRLSRRVWILGAVRELGVLYTPTVTVSS